MYLPRVVLLASLMACSKSKEPPPQPTPAPVVADAPTSRWYRAVFARAGLPAEIPIFIELPAHGTGNATIVNGRNEAQFDAQWSGRDVTIAFSLFHASIDATATDDGRTLAGNWNVKSRTWGESSVPLRAVAVDKPDPAARFDQAALPGTDIDLGERQTVWRMALPESGVARFVLEQTAPGVFEATIQFATGNVVYLAGNARGDRLRMSSLIGLSIYLLDVELDAKRGTMTGTWTAGPNLKWSEKLTAQRGADFALPSSAKIVDRKKPASLQQLAAYKGKPLIVEIGGSWCDTCKLAAATLNDIYTRHHAAGLEIVSLTYEWTDDTAYNQQQAVAFKRAYKIPWEVIPVDGELEQAFDIMPPGLEGLDVSAFPITMFVNRDGTVRALHTSFAGPENAAEHRRWVDEYERQASALVAR